MVETKNPPHTWKTITEHPKKKVVESRSIAFIYGSKMLCKA